MAQPITDVGGGHVANTVLKADGCYDLPAYRYVENLMPYTLSCWQLTPAEVAEVVKTGKIWLHIVGNHPPVSIIAREQDVWEEAKNE